MGSKLDERGRRVFAAGEARAAGWGGVAALSAITGLARSTIGRGLKDLDAAPLPKGQRRGSRFCLSRPSFRSPLGAAVPLALHLLGLGDTHESFRIDVGETLPHVGDLRAFDAPRDAVDAAVPVDRDEVAPVTPRQHPALLLKRRLKFLAAFGRLPDAGHHLLGLLRAQAGTLRLQHLAMARCPFRAWLAVAFDMRALDAVVPELPFEERATSSCLR